MKYKLLLYALVLWAGVAFGAEGTLSGIVKGLEGEAIPGANVVLVSDLLPGGKIGTATDEDGRFRLEGLPTGEYQLSVTHIGYRDLMREGVGIVAGEQELMLTLETGIIFLDQNVVSASRRQEKVLEAPASVAIVEATEIRNRPALSVVEHIRDLPGVDFSQTGLAQSNVVVRGFNNVFSGALLTLTDNRIARVPSLRLNAYNFIPVTNDDIERIEVVLGPGSALYGPNSANGVMHIITHSPFTSAGTNVNVGLGERSVRKVGMRHAGAASDRLGYKVSAQYYTGEDWEYEDPVEVQARAANPAIKPRSFDIERQSAEVRLDYKASDDLTAILAAGYNKGDQIELTGLGAGQAQDWAYNYVQLRLLYKNWFAQVFQNGSNAGDTFTLRDGNPIVDKSKLTAFQLQHSATLGVRQRFTYGADVLLTRPDTEGTITGGNEDYDQTNEFGAYVQSETALSEMLDLVVALRYDDHNRIPEGEISPRAGLVFKPKETQILRLTYNRAFATPSSNNLYLDIRSLEDPFGIGAAFAPSLGFAPAIDIRAQGTYREGFASGWTFARSDNGRPKFRSSFAPVAGMDPADYINLGDPVFTNVMWGLGRSGVLSALDTPLFMGLATTQIGILQELDRAAAEEAAQQLLSGLDALLPAQLTGLDNALLMLNLEKVAAGDPAPFDPVADVFDVPLTRSTTTETFELGYKGIIGEKLVVAADLYHTRIQDFVSPIQVQTPNVFLDPASLGAALGAGVGEALAENAELAAAVAPLDNMQVPGTLSGNGNGSPVDEIVTLFAGGAAGIPFGTVTPEQAFDPTAVMLTYRNFGEISLNGLDVNLVYFPSDQWSLTGSYSYVDKTLFENVDGIADIALNAPGNKFKLGTSFTFDQQQLTLGAQWRYVGAFRQESGVFVGDVDSYSLLDLNASCLLPFGSNLRLGVDVSNALDNKHRTFIGAPEIGRLVFGQLGVAF
ncbi:MAG: TonB-dependent receptor [Gemmatimonadetes bacterium]|nr:TonB-dependent receptor [Gemmatimonadota bacterium]